MDYLVLLFLFFMVFLVHGHLVASFVFKFLSLRSFWFPVVDCSFGCFFCLCAVFALVLRFLFSLLPVASLLTVPPVFFVFLVSLCSLLCCPYVEWDCSGLFCLFLSSLLVVCFLFLVGGRDFLLLLHLSVLQAHKNSCFNRDGLFGSLYE